MVLDYTKPWQLQHALLITIEPQLIDHPALMKYRHCVHTSDMNEDILRYEQVLQELDVKVTRIHCSEKHLPNIIFASDNMLSFAGDIYLPRMCGKRIYEPSWLHSNLPYSTITFPKYLPMESSDVLVGEKFCLVGVGNRTHSNALGFIYNLIKKPVYTITIPRGIQHLMGVIRPIGPSTMLVRSELLNDTDLQLLQGLYDIIEVPETLEVRDKLAFNFVPVAAGLVVIPDDVPDFAEFLHRNYIATYTTSIKNLRKADGGLACATGRLA